MSQLYTVVISGALTNALNRMWFIYCNRTGCITFCSIGRVGHAKKAPDGNRMDLVVVVEVPDMLSVPAFTYDLVRIVILAAKSCTDWPNVEFGFMCKNEKTQYWCNYTARRTCSRRRFVRRTPR